MLTNDHAREAAMPDTTMQAAGLLAGIGKFFVTLFTGLGLTATSFGIGGALATIVVMCAKRPRTAGEWVIALITTLVASFGGGAYVLLKYNLLREAHGLLDVFAIIGIVFACGLPGWLTVRLFFNQMNKAEAEGKGLVEIIRDVRGAL